MKNFKINYVLLNDTAEYSATVRAYDADDADTRFMGDITEQERNDITITSVTEVAA